MTTPTTPVAPSATPAAAAPASPAAPVTPAPVAAAPQPATLNDFAELARQSLAGELPATPAPEPTAPGQEPSPEPAAIAPAEPTPEPAPTPAPGDEPSADEMAGWTEGEKKLHGALVKERTESKEARKQLREFKDKLAELESKLTTTPAPQAEPVAPAAQAPTTPSVAPNLADCTTFEAVDARALQMAGFESQAVNLQNMLLRNGVEPVAAKLKAGGVENIGTTPIAEASADQIGEFLAAVYENAKIIQAQAPIRKNWLMQYHQSLQEAVKLIPELGDKSSPAFEAARQMIAEDPGVRSKANWPVILAKRYLGVKGFETASKPTPPTPPAAPAARPTPKPSAPGAPRTSTAALPTANVNSALKEKIAQGTATLAEVQQYAREHVAA